MHDFFCTEPEDMYFKLLSDKARYFKENEKGVAAMCKVMEDMRTETARITEERTRTEMALDMIKDGVLSLEQIARYTRLAVDKVKELAAGKAVEV